MADEADRADGADGGEQCGGFRHGVHEDDGLAQRGAREGRSAEGEGVFAGGEGAEGCVGGRGDAWGSGCQVVEARILRALKRVARCAGEVDIAESGGERIGAGVEVVEEVELVVAQAAAVDLDVEGEVPEGEVRGGGVDANLGGEDARAIIGDGRACEALVTAGLAKRWWAVRPRVMVLAPSVIVVMATASLGIPLPPKVAPGSGPKVVNVGVRSALAVVQEARAQNKKAAASFLMSRPSVVKRHGGVSPGVN